MKKNTTKAQVLLSQLKNNLSLPNNVISVKLKYPSQSFRRKVVSVSNLYKTLSNGKNTLMGLGTNRDWWNRHNCKGVYFSQQKMNEIEVIFLISCEKRINSLELKSRINKILKPTQMEVIFDNPSIFLDFFNEDSIFESGFQFFGKNQILEMNVS